MRDASPQERREQSQQDESISSHFLAFYPREGKTVFFYASFCFFQSELLFLPGAYPLSVEKKAPRIALHACYTCFASPFYIWESATVLQGTVALGRAAGARFVCWSDVVRVNSPSLHGCILHRPRLSWPCASCTQVQANTASWYMHLCWCWSWSKRLKREGICSRWDCIFYPIIWAPCGYSWDLVCCEGTTGNSCRCRVLIVVKGIL